MYEDIESMAPVGGNTLPSRRRTGCSRGSNIDAMFRQMDREAILRKVSTYPPCERKMWLRLLTQQYRNRK